MKAPKMTIVLARTEVGFEVVRPGAADLGIRPTLKEIAVPRACVWLNRGTAADLAKATAYAPTEGYRVFTYPTSERDPLGRAMQDVMNA